MSQVEQKPSVDTRKKWGYSDTRFEILPNGSVVLTGDRYDLCGLVLPGLVGFTSETLGVEIDPFDIAEEVPPDVPDPYINSSFFDELGSRFSADQYSLDDGERLAHSHGQTAVDEVYQLFYGRIKKVVDLVFYPETQQDVEDIVALSIKHDVCLVPRGGGTSVTNALQLPEQETRMIVSVNLGRLNRVLHVDEDNLIATVEAGILGSRLESELGKLGYTMGHEPDSVEFSTLGGWIATNASGMKKNKYGNIEDIVLGMTLVTPSGVIEESKVHGRVSAGMRLNRALFGNEGNLGIVTKADVRICRKPDAKKYQAFLFPDFSTGVSFLKELNSTMAPPASIRLMDNQQYHFGFAFKPESSTVGRLKHRFTEWFITKVRGFDFRQFSAATVVFEGSTDEVRQHERRLRKLAKKHGAIVGGGKNGQRGYDLTFAIAYIRDLYNKWHIIGETIETTVPWDRILDLYDAVLAHANKIHKEHDLPGKPLICGRVTQVYQTEVCVYFTYAMHIKGVENPTGKFAELEHSIRDVILEHGGSISHHHGVGKIRQGWMKNISGETTTMAIKAIKNQLDPSNVFGIRNNVFED